MNTDRTEIIQLSPPGAAPLTMDETALTVMPRSPLLSRKTDSRALKIAGVLVPTIADG
jgi:hypothetical protein